MKTICFKILMLLAVVSVGTLSSCRFRCKRGSGNMVAENRKMSDFSKIDISGGFKVKLIQDSSLNVNIRADDNLIKYIETSVGGGKLSLKSSKNICSSGEIAVIIGVRNLQDVHASGAVEITSASRINTGDINFDLSGSAKLDVDLNAATVNTSGSGATEIFLKGQAGTHNVEIKGSGNIEALDFVVGKYSIRTSGASHCKINVLNNLSVHTSGASEIEYRGNPANVSNDKSGSSSLKKLD